MKTAKGTAKYRIQTGIAKAHRPYVPILHLNIVSGTVRVCVCVC